MSRRRDAIEGRIDFCVRKDEPAEPGCGDMVSVTSHLKSNDISLSVERSGRRADGRDRRSILIHLDRREALALARHIIGEVSGLSVPIDRKGSEVRADLDLWGDDRYGTVMSRLSASSVGEDVFLSLREFHFETGGLAVDPDAAALMTKVEAQAFARALLAVSQE